MPGTTRAIALYRALARAGRGFNDYNVREYVRRRAREGFEDHRAARGADAARAIERGMEALAVVRRQAGVFALYGNGRRPSAMDVR
ncbi:Complex 1 LYR protein [Ostreococcus tauri]|uniref:Complex 1 LYR protein n=1 Tax=Ostreococcus tauri TaxID=70448 RepID=A0A090M6V6_OSTTA|nr:Complex 1 LYR protein [Ostreococcus tauri]OUS48424.1 hypothetical protein BE221DRAFT_68736 [Ostreococcus tauri]CEF98387.1 Complex 1 LYR protein [Ostreococcus tauri]|eukprot:XP_003079898.2 Complex 1 LYR protein [Ostreococcus tauri]